MLVTLSALALAALIGTTSVAPGAFQTVAASGDSGQVVWMDSTTPTPLARRSRATVGFRLAGEADAASPELPDTATSQRRRAVEHSDWYYRRLTIHKAASWATIPVFAAEYYLGDKLYRDKGTSSTKSQHSAVAGGLGVLFGVNTITGVWNLWDSRHESQGRARRITHSVLMLASDAGFVATAAMAPEGDDRNDFGESTANDRSRHRAVAVGSMGVATVSYLMMFLWK
jgi:hypothetical protein